VVEPLPSITEHSCRYGKMLALSNDTVIGRSLAFYGEWSEHELECLHPYVPVGGTVVDVGANIGTHTLAFAKWVGPGRVISVEPQPVIHGLLTTNCLLNGHWNVEAVNALCSNRAGWAHVEVDYGSTENSGAITFRAHAGIRDRSPWARVRSLVRPAGTKSVPIVRLDDILAGRNADFLKLDIEGMELECLQGAKQTLLRSKPVIFMEQSDTSALPLLHDLLSRLRYDCYWLETHPFNRNNFRGATKNLWWRTETGILALPQSLPRPFGLTAVQPTDTQPPSLLDARQGIAIPEAGNSIRPSNTGGRQAKGSSI